MIQIHSRLVSPAAILKAIYSLRSLMLVFKIPIKSLTVYLSLSLAALLY